MVNRLIIADFLNHFCGVFRKLQEKWQVGGVRLLLILATFAIGGSLCGYAGRKLLLLLNVKESIFRIALYIIFITLLWPVAVILVSIPLGQFSFFKNYLRRVFARVGGKKPAKEQPLNIAIFASGTGTNTEKIIKDLARVKLFKSTNQVFRVLSIFILTDNGRAGVLKVAADNDIPATVIDVKNKTEDELTETYFSFLRKQGIQFIILAGYLKKIPAEIIKAYPEKIVNIHPALLPAYGGAGMYGKRVHEAVISAGEKESGITIHYADDIYDNGKIIYQEKCPVEPNETSDTLAAKIHALEHHYYPKIIREILQSQNLR